MQLFFNLWLMHVVMASWVVVPMAVLARRRARWEYWEATVFVLPFVTWYALMLSPLLAGRKSLANLREPGFISVAIVAATAVRLTWGSRPGKRLVSVALIAAVVAVAAGAFFLTPMLPE